MNINHNITYLEFKTLSFEQKKQHFDDATFRSKKIGYRPEGEKMIEEMYLTYQKANYSLEKFLYDLTVNRVNYVSSTIQQKITKLKSKYGSLRTDSVGKKGNHPLSFPYDTRKIDSLLPILNRVYCTYINTKDFLVSEGTCLLPISFEKRISLKHNFAKIALKNKTIASAVLENATIRDQIFDFFESLLRLDIKEQRRIYDIISSDMVIKKVKYGSLIPQPEYSYLKEKIQHIVPHLTVKGLKEFLQKHGSVAEFNRFVEQCRLLAETSE